MKRPPSVVLGLLIAVAIGPAVTSAHPAEAASTAIARLSGDVVPISYDLHIEPVNGVYKNWSVVTTRGSETIVVRALRRVAAITLNESAISVSDATIDGQVVVVSLSPSIEQMTVRPTHTLDVGEHTVHLVFEGHVPGTGFRNTYLANGPALTTFFEPSAARASFPCFDEPEFRARFTLHVTAPSAWTVISNMPLAQRSSLGDGTDRSDFPPTPPMQTYLLTFDMGAFAHVNGVADGIPIRVFVSPGEETQARGVLNDAQRLLPFYEKFFGTRYPLPKLDLIVTHRGYDSALEGWGAITFYMTEDVFGKQFGRGVLGRRLAVEEVAHEMAHQWVGDLVDMRWWRDTFVAEGLAEFAQQRAVATVFPDLQSGLDDDRNTEFVLDGYIDPGTHPVLSPVATDLGLDDQRAFDYATYEKGAAVVRQWQMLIGQQRFSAAIERYLQSNAFGSATAEQFWSSFPDRPGALYGAQWLGRPGYPLVDVDVECRASRSSVVVSQRAFVNNPLVGVAYRRQLWSFPLDIVIGGREHVLAVPDRARSRFSVSGCGVTSVDASLRPYARLRYHGDALRGLATHSVRERERVFTDYAVMQRFGDIRTTDYFDALNIPGALDGVSVATLGTIAPRLADVANRLRGSSKLATVTALEERLFRPVVFAPGAFDGSANSFDQRGLGQVLGVLASAGDATISPVARAEFFRRSATPGFSQIDYSLSEAAGVTADRADVDRVEATMRGGQAPDYDALFLSNVRDEGVARRILEDAGRDPRLAGVGFVPFLDNFAYVHPLLAFAYLRAHVRQVRATVPPSQQDYLICSLVDDAMWPAAPPAELEHFLRKVISPTDAATLVDANAKIERDWASRRALEAVLR